MNGFSCANCGKLSKLCVVIDQKRRLVICSDKCAVKKGLFSAKYASSQNLKSIDAYYPGVNLTFQNLSRQEFGHQGWILKHTIAYNYVDSPNDNQKLTMKTFINAFANVYPCRICRSHLIPMIEQNPPDLSSRASLIKWVCDRHNEVSVRLGNPTLPFEFDGKLRSPVAQDRFAVERLRYARTQSFASDDYYSITKYEGNLTNMQVSRERLGKATWLLLHSMAAAYHSREKVTKTDRDSMFMLLKTLSFVYPYEDERRELEFEINKTNWTFVLSDRSLLMRWMAKFHNRINAKLGKPIYSLSSIQSELEAYRCDH